MPAGDADLRVRYIELVKRAVSGLLGRRGEEFVRAEDAYLTGLSTDLLRALGDRGLFVARKRQVEVGGRLDGTFTSPPADGHSMVGLRRLDHLHQCVETVLAEGVPGHFIETGVWRGGVIILMRAVLMAHGVTDREVWAADSFAGVPAGRLDEDLASQLHEYPELAVSADEVRENLRLYGLLDGQVKFLEGLFGETLPYVADRRFALVRLDGDLYESTRDALENLYPVLSPRGYVIVDDYGSYDGCRKAVDEYIAAHRLDVHISRIDHSAVFWRKA